MKKINIEKLQKDLEEVKERADIVLDSLEKRRHAFYR